MRLQEVINLESSVVVQELDLAKFSFVQTTQSVSSRY